jgi:cytochrome c-type biogenesis protein CcmH
MRALIVVFVLLGAPAFAQDATAPSSGPSKANTEAQAIFREVMSPFCPGLTLADCPSPNAFTMRGDIEARLAKGESRDAILDELVTKYGTQILADPSDTPIGSVVWGVPFVLSGLAAIGLAVFLRRATRTHEEPPALAAAGPPGIRERLEEELAELD